RGYELAGAHGAGASREDVDDLDPGRVGERPEELRRRRRLLVGERRRRERAAAGDEGKLDGHRSTGVNISIPVDLCQALTRDGENALHARCGMARHRAEERVLARLERDRNLGRAAVADDLALLRLDALALDRHVVLE